MVVTRSQRIKQARRINDAMRNYSIFTGTLAVYRPVETAVILRMMADTEEEREAIAWALFGRDW